MRVCQAATAVENHFLPLAFHDAALQGNDVSCKQATAPGENEMKNELDHIKTKASFGYSQHSRFSSLRYNCRIIVQSKLKLKVISIKLMKKKQLSIHFHNWTCDVLQGQRISAFPFPCTCKPVIFFNIFLSLLYVFVLLL